MTNRLIAGLLAALLPGCGGGGGSVTAPPAPAPPAPVTTVIEEGVIQLGPNRVTWGNVQSAWSGRLEVVVDWTSPGNNLDVVLTRGACDYDQLQAATCILMGAAESPTEAGTDNGGQRGERHVHLVRDEPRARHGVVLLPGRGHPLAGAGK